MKATLILSVFLITACAVDGETTKRTPQAKVTTGDEETRAQIQDVVDEADGKLPSEKLPSGVGPAFDQESANLLATQHPGLAQYCFINLHYGLSLNAPVRCRGAVLPNWFVDNDGGAHYDSARCAYRAYEWYLYCGIPRATFSQTWLTNGSAWIPGKAPNGAGLGAVYGPSGWAYYVP